MPQVSKSFRVFSEARRRKQLTRSPGILIFLKPLAEESSIGIGQQNNVSLRSISSLLVVKLSIQNFFSGTQILKLKNQSFVLVNLACVVYHLTELAGWNSQFTDGMRQSFQTEKAVTNLVTLSEHWVSLARKSSDLVPLATYWWFWPASTDMVMNQHEFLNFLELTEQFSLYFAQEKSIFPCCGIDHCFTIFCTFTPIQLNG